MAVTSESTAFEGEVSAQNEKKGRSKCSGVRVLNGRIYDSQNGKTCHQCRQKSRDSAATCNNQKVNKQCTITYCRKCLLNRYGERVEEVALPDVWKCPKCRGICNCSFCMKKRGCKPTGIMVRTAKKNGFSSVSELLSIKGHDSLNHDKDVECVDASPQKPAATENVSPTKPGKENLFDGNINLNFPATDLALIPDVKDSKKTKRRSKETIKDNVYNEASLKENCLKKCKTTYGVSNSKLKTSGKEDAALAGRNTSEKEIKINGRAKVASSVHNDKAPTVSTGILNHANLKHGVELTCIENSPETKMVLAIESCTISQGPPELQNKQIEPEVELPLGTCLKIVAGIELPAEDVGQALQFLEFCTCFGKVLDLKKGQPEAVLREIISGRKGRRSQYSLVAHIHILLLSLIHRDLGEEPPTLSPTKGQKSWLQALGECVSKCQFISNEFPSNCFDGGNEQYDELNTSKKFKLLNFLCDETLNTTDLRSWIDEQKSIFREEMKEAKEKLLASQNKEKQLKEKIQDEVAKAIIAKAAAPSSVSEHEAIVSQIKSETARAHSEMLEAKGIVSKKIRRSDAVRTDPMLLDVNGRVFWRLKGYDGQSAILLQDVGTWDSDAFHEKWLVFGTDEQKRGIDKYLSSLRVKRVRAKRVAGICS